MLERGFLRDNSRKSRHDNRRASGTAKWFFIIGIIIVILSLVFMLFNVGGEDSFVKIWLPVMMIGIFLIIVNILVNFIERNRKTRFPEDNEENE